MNKKENQENLIERIGYFRNEAQLSARELSLRIDKNAAYINHFESGRFYIGVPVLTGVLEALDISFEEFFFR